MVALVQQVDWIVGEEPDGPECEVIKLTCPRCFNCFWVPKDAWPGHSAIYGARSGRTMDNYIGRSCPYCFSTPHVPDMVVIRGKDGPDLVIPYTTAVGLQMASLIVFWMDTPSGAVYMPVTGVSMEKISRSIVWNHDNGS